MLRMLLLGALGLAIVVASGLDASTGGFGSALSFDAPFDLAAAGARVAALVLALSVARPSRPLWVALVALFVVSLLGRGLGVPFSLFATYLAWSGGAAQRPRGLVPAAFFLAAGAAFAVKAAARKPPDAPGSASSPQADVARELARKNVYRAHAAALAWAAAEPIPGEGYLQLAAIDLDLGDPVKARKVLQKVIARGTDASVVDRARALDAKIP